MSERRMRETAWRPHELWFGRAVCVLAIVLLAVWWVG